MPIYEYFCRKCQKEFELMLPICDMDKKALCPDCGGKGERLVSPCASKLGFYVRVPEGRPFRQHAARKTAKRRKAGRSKKAK